MYSVGPSQNYAKQLPVICWAAVKSIFWAAVKSIFRMRLTSYNIQMAATSTKIIVEKNWETFTTFTLPYLIIAESFNCLS